ncbi:MAG TPA: amino acid deaminase/aldolase [Candidatus Obscuribacterales bacterium]
MNYRELKLSFADRTPPFAFLDLDALDANLAQVLDRAGPLPVRIASKSIRCRWVLNYLLAASEQIQGLMCFTPAEALWLSQQGFDRLLLGYPSQDQQALLGLCVAIAAGKTICLMLDSSEQGRQLEQIAATAGVTLPICLDIDMSSDFPGLHFGVWRSPLRNMQALEALLYHLQPLRHLRISGLMGYEAQIAGLGDQMPGQAVKNQVIRLLQRRSLREAINRRQQAVTLLQRHGHVLDFVNGGGTGSLELTAGDASVTELTAGSAFFAPTLFDAYSRFQLQPAAGFALPIVRQPAAGIHTCLGGGYIASGSAGSEKQPQIWQPAGASLTELEGAGEVQTPVLYQGPEPLQLGDPIFFRHAKAGELCERFDRLYLLRSGEIVDVVPTYRGEGKTFL